MPCKDIKSSKDSFLLMNSTISSNTNTDSAELDLSAYNSGVKINVLASAYTDGIYAIQLHTSDTSGFTPSSTTLLSGDALIGDAITISAITSAGSAISSQGFISAKRYFKVRVVSTSVTTGANIIINAEAKKDVR